MSWENDPEILACENYIMEKGKLTLKHIKKKSGNTTENLFRTKDFVSSTTHYNTKTPGSNSSDLLLTSENPKLLALRNKSVKNSRPQVFTPNQVGRTNRSVTKLCATLNSRPLSNLRKSFVSPIVKVNKAIEEEAKTLQFEDDPVAYFSKVKDGRGHHFIYLVHKFDVSDPNFSPYSLRKATSHEIKNEYFTMSTHGVTRITKDGVSENMSLEQWSKEQSIYESIRKLRFFSAFRLWCPFMYWKNFVTKARYQSKVLEFAKISHFRNREFFACKIQIVKGVKKLTDNLGEYLLNIQSQKMYSMSQFENVCTERREKLKQICFQHMKGLANLITDELYRMVGDPKLAEVHDDMFTECQSKQPSIVQIHSLERKKAQLRKEKTINVNEDIMAIGPLIRFADYFILESLLHSCIASFKQADKIISTKLSSVFKVNVRFNSEGKVILDPTFDNIEKSVRNSLKTAIEFLNTLPRLIYNLDIRPLLRDSGINLEGLFKVGPSFKQIVETTDDHLKCEDHMIEILKSSYYSSLELCQCFEDYYDIYKIGMTWNVMNYVTNKNGTPYRGLITDLQRDSFQLDQVLQNPNGEPTVNFEKITEDLKLFSNHLDKVNSIRLQCVKGALFIDSQDFKSLLQPIPSTSINDILTLLESMSSVKIQNVKSTLINYGKRLRADPTNLQDYISLCDIIKKADLIIPIVEDEISFVTSSYNIISEYNENFNNLNPLISLFDIFKSDKAHAYATRKNRSEEFTKVIKKRCSSLEEPIKDAYDKAVTFPSTVEKAYEMDCLSQSQLLYNKINEMEKDVVSVVSDQKAADIHINDFKIYKICMNQLEICVKLYNTVNIWIKLRENISKVPFNDIIINDFIQTYNEVFNSMQTIKEKYQKEAPIINELDNAVNGLKSYVSNIELLGKTDMLERHWISLFEQTKNSGKYHQKITIRDLVEAKVVSFTDIVKSVTSIASAESEIESEFRGIYNKWLNYKLQFRETTLLNENTMFLNPIDSLLFEINDTRILLDRLLATQFSSHISADIKNLINDFDMAESCLSLWYLFQKNKEILLDLFSLSEVKKLLPEQNVIFEGVIHQWNHFAGHVLKDSRLLKVISYPNLYNMLYSKNKDMEKILSSLDSFLDSKRQTSPRLFFLSDLDTISLYSDKNYLSFSSISVKMFMNIQKFDIHSTNDNADMNVTKIHSMIGTTGDILNFLEPVDIISNIELTINSIVDSMHQSLKGSIVEALNSFELNSFTDWVLMYTTHVSQLVFNIVSTREIETSIKNFASDPKALTEYNSVIVRRSNSLATAFFPGISVTESNRLSIMITHLNTIRDRCKNLIANKKDYIPELEFLNILKTVVVGSENDIFLESSTHRFEYGYEFWGVVPRLIFTDEIERVYQTIARANGEFGSPMVVSDPCNGKTSLLLHLASAYGRAAFIFRPFPNICSLSVHKIIKGMHASGVWTIFSSIDQMNESDQSLIFDHIIMSNCNNNADRYILSGNLHTFSKDARIFFTSNNISYENTNTISSQLKAYIRPISLIAPDIQKLAYSMLTYHLYYRAAGLSNKLFKFLSCVRLLLPIAVSSSLVLKIIEAAYQVYRLTNEATSIIVGIEAVIGSMMDKDILFNMLHSIFNITPNVQELVNIVDEIKNDNTRKEILKLIKREVELLSVRLDIDKFSTQVLRLYKLIQDNTCTIISGPQHTGKSLLLKVIEKVMNMEEFALVQPDVKPYKIHSCYMIADRKVNIFGSSDESGYKYGQVMSLIYEHNINNTNFQNVIKFDGIITKEFDMFLSSFLGSEGGDNFMFGSYDTFKRETMKIIVETTNISNISSSLMSKVGWFDTFPRFNKYCFHCNLIYVLFNSASKSKDFATEEILRAVEPSFESFAVSFINRIFSLQNEIVYTGKPVHTRDSTQYIYHTLATFACLSTFRLAYSNTDLIKSDQTVKIALSIGFFEAFSGILAEPQRNEIEDWLIQQYSLPIPNKWSMNLPKEFIDVYPKPTLYAMEFKKCEFLPLNVDMFFRKGDYVVHPSLLSPLNTATKLVKNGINTIIHGKIGCGKSTFLSILFENTELMHPIYVKPSQFRSLEGFTLFIKNQTSFYARSIRTEVSNILVVEDLNETDIEFMEMIRMISSENMIRLCSPNDPKYVERHKLQRFTIIITTNCLGDLPPRFLSDFAVVRLPELNELFAKQISTKILEFNGYNNDMAREIVDFASLVYFEKELLNPSISLIESSKRLAFYDQKDNTANVIKILMSELYFRTLHKLNPSTYTDFILSASEKSLSCSSLNEIVNEFLGYTTFIHTKYVHTNNPNIILKDINHADSCSNLHETVSKINQDNYEPIKFRVTETSMKMYETICHTLDCPGKNLQIIGENYSDILSFIRLYSLSHEVTAHDFIIEVSDNDLKKYIDLSVKLAIENKRTLFFVNYRGASRTAELLIEFCSCYSFLNFFTQNEINELYKLADPYINSNDYESCLRCYEKINSLILKNCSIVVTSPQPLSHLLSFDCVHMPESKDLDVVFYAIQTLMCTTVGHVVKDCVPDIDYIIERLISVIPGGYSSHCNNLFTFVEKFVDIVEMLIDDAITRYSQITKAKSVLEGVDSEIALLSKKIASVEPAVNAAVIDRDDIHDSSIPAKDVRETGTSKISGIMEEKTNEVKSVDNTVKNHIADDSNYVTRCEILKDKILQLPDDEINILKVYEGSPPMELRLLVEVFCIFLGFEPNFDTKGLELLNDQRFAKTLVEKVVPDALTPDLRENLNKYFSRVDFKRENLERIVPILGMLYEFADLTLKIAITSAGLYTETLRMKDTHSEFAAVSDELESTQIMSTIEGSEVEGELLNESSGCKAQLEDGFVGLKDKLDILESLNAGLKDLREKWDNEYTSFQDVKKCIIAKVLLAVYYCTILISFPSQDRCSSLKQASDILNPLYNFGDDPLRHIEAFLVELYPKYFTERRDIISDNQISVAIVSAMLVNTIPLVIDSDGFFLRAITKIFNPTVVSQSDLSADNYIKKAISDGTMVILTDVVRMAPLLSSVIEISSDITGSNKYVTLDGSKILYNKNFKLILIAGVIVQSLPTDLTCKTLIINCDHSNSLRVHDHFRSIFLDHMNNDSGNTLMKALSNNVQQIYDKHLADKTCLKLLSTDPKLLQNRSRIDSFNENKDIFNKNMDQTYIDRIRCEYLSVSNVFDPCVKSICLLWTVISSKLPTININSLFGLDQLSEIVVTYLSIRNISTIPSPEQISKLTIELSDMILQTVIQSLPINDVFHFLLIFICTSNSFAEVDQIDAAITEFVTKSISKVSYARTSVPLEPSFSNIKNASFTDLYETLSKFIKNNTSTIGEKFISQFNVESIITTSSSHPTIVISEGNSDPTSCIVQFCLSKMKPECVVQQSISSSASSCCHAKKSIEYGMKNGLWTIIHYSQPSFMGASVLSEVFAMMKADKVSKDFRLIILCHDTNFIPSTLLMCSRKLCYQSFVSVKAFMYQNFDRYSSIIQLPQYSLKIKKLTYIALSLLGLMPYRTSLPLSGTIRQIIPVNTAPEECIKDILHLLAANRGMVPLSNVRSVIANKGFSSIRTQKDFDFLCYNINMALPATFIENDFSLSRRNSKWVVPGDIPFSQICDHISKLQHFPGSGPLRLPKSYSRIRDWYVSKYLSQSFLKGAKLVIPEESVANIEKILEIMPPYLSIDNSSKLATFKGVFLLKEIEIYNNVLGFVRENLCKAIQELRYGKPSMETKLIINDIIPNSWSTFTKTHTSATLSHFLVLIQGFYDQYSKWLNEGIKNDIDARYVFNLKMLLYLHMIEVAPTKQSTTNNLEYQCEIYTDDAPYSSDELILKNLSLSFSYINNSKVSFLPNDCTAPFTSNISVKFSLAKQSTEKTTAFPLYREAMIDTHENEHIIDIQLPYEGDKHGFLVNGAAFYTNVHEQLIDN